MRGAKLAAFPGAIAIGIGARTRNADELDARAARIPALWGRFFAEGVAAKVTTLAGAGAHAAPVVGVYSEYESDHAGAYSLVAGVIAGERTAVPPGMCKVVIPAGSYLVFRGRGEMPRVVADTWRAVWEHFADASRGRRAYAVDFELYPEPGVVEVYVSVK
jgi:predicted transcriptional regulator YdeE